ncbi:hypothetical protein B0H11DRAFT_2277780, partial [Mycena galericulata]
MPLLPAFVYYTAAVLRSCRSRNARTALLPPSAEARSPHRGHAARDCDGDLHDAPRSCEAADWARCYGLYTLNGCAFSGGVRFHIADALLTN